MDRDGVRMDQLFDGRLSTHLVFLLGSVVGRLERGVLWWQEADEAVRSLAKIS